MHFSLPVYGDTGEMISDNIFCGRMLVRRDADGRLYLYDIVRIKKRNVQPA